MSTKLDWSDVRRRLLALMREVGAEISAYPRPITACDAQFNHLLELRRMLPAELARLSRLCELDQRISAVFASSH